MPSVLQAGSSLTLSAAVVALGIRAYSLWGEIDVIAVELAYCRMGKVCRESLRQKLAYWKAQDRLPVGMVT